MLKKLSFVGVALGLTACAPGGIMSTGEVTDLNVEGVLISVQNYNQKPNSWAAAPKDLSGGLIDPNTYRLNVLAIEAFTGCTVDPVTVVNTGMQTIAVVDCS